MLPRRQFVHGLAGGGVLFGLASRTKPSWSNEKAQSNLGTPVLSGKSFDLTIAETPANFTGNVRPATTINGSIPAPTLRWREGETVTIRVTNRLAESTSIHWHGIILPYQMDGVPGISFPGIAPGETFTYRFKVEQSGTYWYHSHSGMQELTGMYGAIVVEPAAGDLFSANRDHVVLLSDWTDDDPSKILSKLKVQSDYYNYNQPTATAFYQDLATDGMKAALDKRKMWNQMRMSPTDLADLSASAMTFLMNGATPAGNWTGLFGPGEKIRLRFINGSSNTFYDVRIPGVKLTVIQADGVNVEPVSVDEFRFGPGETYDALVSPQDEAHTIFAQTMDRSGFASGTLATRAGLKASIPTPDAPQWLSMLDMMGTIGSMPGMTGMAEMRNGSVKSDHSMMPGTAQHNSSNASNVKVRHARTEFGPSTDQRVDRPRINIDDPGIGLRDNGRRVLTLADLHTIAGPLDPRGPEREIELHLTGNMERYTWSFDGLEFGQSTPVHLRHGERVRIVLHNDTMMTHPMHMHGMWSELETPEGRFQVRRHTIPVQPAQRVSFLVTADALGRWAWHCHLLLHMDAGMFRQVMVS